ncbi:MAG: hypothetical protein WCD35_10555 [Mycobacteriales bacterium]
MEHVVFFPAHDGTPAFRRVGSLEDAVRLVEHLRNVEGVNEVSVHALNEVPLAFKPYYRVEVPGAAEAVAQAGPQPVEQPVAEAPAAELEVPQLVADEPVGVVPDQPVVALATSNGKHVDAPSSLGFFAS